MQRRQSDQQLSKVELRIYVVAAACRGKAGQDGSGATVASVVHEKAVLPSELL